MKKAWIVSAAFFLLSFTAFAQNTPENYWKKTPAVPKNICTASFDEVTRFNDQIRILKDEIKKESESRTENLSSDANREKAAKQHLGAAGLSAADVEKLQKEEMSDAEAAALAARIMSGQPSAQAKSADDIRRERKDRSQNTFGVLERQQARKQALSNAQNQYYVKNVLPIESEKPLSTGSMDAQQKWAAAHNKRLFTARKAYCEKFAPQRMQNLDSMKSGIKEEMARVRRYEGKQMSAVGAGNQDILLLNMLDSYLDELKDVFELNITEGR